MLYFQMPGLHKIMIAFAKNKGIGIQKAMEEIEHIYWFTFQQKQAQKAAAILLKDHEIAHLYIHFVLKKNNHPLLEKLARKTRIARLYLMLFEAKYQKDQIMFVCQKIPEEKGYRFNDEMVNTLEAVYHLLTANSLKDFYQAVDNLEGISGLPVEISYFSSIESMASQLKKIKEELEKIEDIERFETKRSFMNEQKEKLKALEVKAGEIFYEPFQNIWKNALLHCSKLVAREIKLLQGSAVLSIDLRNREILASDENRALYFVIINKGQELASNISITLQAEGPDLLIIGDTVKKLPVVESGSRKEISFDISAGSPRETNVKGTVTFSDRAREGKQMPFSFSITVLKKSAVFREIRNPYIVGPALKGGVPLFFGREDAFDFINKNIVASGDHHTIVCHGLRRTGKTSLLYHIEHRGFADKRLVPINIDMQGIGNEKHLYSTLSDDIVERLSLPGFSQEKTEDFGQFKSFLKKIKPGMGEKIMVLMLDEFEAIQTLAEDKRIPKTTFNNIRHLMQHEEKLIFLFCGTHKLEEMSADYWSIFFNTAIYYRLSHLHYRDAARLIKEPVKGQLTYDDLAIEQILKMTGCQPYLVQLLCRTLVNDLNENKKKNDVVIDDVDDAVEHIIKEREEKFSLHIWDDSNWNERLILSSAAEELTNTQWDHIGMDALFDKIKTACAGISGQQLMEALEKLVSKEILLEKEMRYCFPVNLLRKWIAARYPLRKVLTSGGQG
jgi:AAA+ ATPase superfamily predicted ATPase